MTMGAVLVPNSYLDKLLNCLDVVKSKIGKSNLHCSNLKHHELVYYAKQVSTQKVRIFGVISKKETLGSYKSAINENPKMYYNKCAQYLLERVGWYMESRNIQKNNLSIIFEEANVDYKKLRNFIEKCQKNPHHEFTRKLQNISADQISYQKKNENRALWTADLVAHALYCCVNKSDSNLEIVEPRYCRELLPRFFGNPDTGAALGAGLYCVHSLDALQLDQEVSDLFRNATPD